MSKNSVIVRAEWDPEAGVYVGTSEDVPGLVAEAATLPELQEKLADLIPALLEMNGDDGDVEFSEVPLHLMAHIVSKIRVPC